MANVFHAGDGNLHPLVLYDARNPGEEERAEHLGGDILRLCVRLGGSITGEHGVGAEKAAYMADMFGAADLETMALVRCAFDPEDAFNPGKVFPTPRLCGERPGPDGLHPAEVAGRGAAMVTRDAPARRRRHPRRRPGAGRRAGHRRGGGRGHGLRLCREAALAFVGGGTDLGLGAPPSASTR